VLEGIKRLERDIGRQPAAHWGPRLIDIDLISYNQAEVQSESLTLPHPQLSNRAFVLAPLADIAPGFTHPVTGQSVKRMLESVALGAVRRLDHALEQLGLGGKFMKIKNVVTGERTLVMGILNATPDSFSGDGLWMRGDAVSLAVRQAVRFVAEGADLLDIGGESTRPISIPVSAEEELARVLPVVVAVRQAVDVPISIDTYRASVAEAALAAGADLVNDVWGLRMDPDMAGVVAKNWCPVVLMHNRSKPKSEEQSRRLREGFRENVSGDILGMVRRELEHSIHLAHAAGIKDSQIIVDPGIGFGKTLSQNLQLISGLNRLAEMGYPVLIGPSRKSFIGSVLDLPEDDRLEGTAAVIALAIDRGASIVRVHDVKSMVRVARMVDRTIRE
jgi:dihydropteroate synthase